MVIEADWAKFRAKFSGKEQKTFEWFCSLLFYKEHHHPTASLRYRNQAGIEADPITVGKDVIGWQAKFLDSKISARKLDLMKAIDDAKNEHPTLTRILFYLNVDFNPSTRPGIKEPKSKIDIEKHAKAKGIEITWRTAVFFESPFVCEENGKLAKHFFTLGEKSTIDFVNELSRHTEAILNPIRSEITFSDKTIKIDRSLLIISLKETIVKSSLIVVSGDAGVGKTAVIKDFYNQIKGTVPFFVFKANEFNASNVNEIFRGYGSFTLSDLVQEFQDTKEKYVIVDSAEKLSDIEHQEVFQEFLSTLRKDDWKILFTTRLSYLDDLKNSFIQIYNVSFEPLNISNLTNEELAVLSTQYQFSLPRSERLQMLLRNPFYLNEYLNNYPVGAPALSYTDFKDTIWNKQIAKSSYRKNNTHRKRENCFLEIARKRATTGNFYVSAEGYDDQILQQLESDEIIKFDSSARGYFITHDIYEEWALDKVIEQEFHRFADYNEFFESIGSSLAIRRAFRNWLSEKLALNDSSIMAFIVTTVESDSIAPHWKDESLVAVLLSSHAANFIDHFERKLSELPEKVIVQGTAAGSYSEHYKYENCLLYKILFLLRIACKEIDLDFLKSLGISKFDDIAFSMLITMPKGQGWESVIKFINKHKDKFGLIYLHFTLPLLDDWNRHFKKGETTRNASQIALFYYEELTKEHGFYFDSRDKTREMLIKTILNGSYEIKTELINIVDGIVAQKDTSHRGRYYALAKTALSSLIDSSVIANNLPKEVIRLAELFWFKIPDYEDWGLRDHFDIEQDFGLSSDHHQYFPASAFQTPIFQLLQTAPQEAVNFILAFTNKSMGYFAKSELAQNEIEEVDVVVDDSGKSVKQYICNRIWNIYRGTQVAPPLLCSMHMALERWLIMIVAQYAKPEILEAWCLYLLKNSRSASITAVVASVVLAEPSKLFNVAQVLFRTKELFFYDMSRFTLDKNAKGLYSMGYIPKAEIFKDERLQTCDDKHRSMTLESQALFYQVFANEEEGEVEANRRQEILWKIIDEHYAKLPDEDKETDGDKSWRLCLARMDRRKMDIKVEKMDGNYLINFNPKLDPELKQHSENSLATISKEWEHTPLQLWSHYRIERKEEEYKKYPQYEDNHKNIISETEKIIEGLQDDKSDDLIFTLLCRAIPAYACAVLIRDFFGQLDEKEKVFCNNVLLHYSSLPLTPTYEYQVGDGVDVALNVLPLLLNHFLQDSALIKETLLFTLFNQYPAAVNQRLSDFSVVAILKYLWKESPIDANSIFVGYLLLKPKYDELSELARDENIKTNVYGYLFASVLERLKNKYKQEIAAIVANQVNLGDISDVNKMDPNTLAIAFLLLPLETTDEDHKKFVREITPVLSTVIKNNDRKEKLDYGLQQKFLERLSYFVLSSEKEEIATYLQPFIDNFQDERETEEIISDFVSAEDRLNKYEEFWTVWSLFYPKIVELCKRSHIHPYHSNIVHSYLLAWPYWPQKAKEWHSLKERERAFLKKVSEDIGSHPAVLYSLSKLLNEIGSNFADEGIFWISDVINNNPNLATEVLEVNTEYYLETLIRTYILRNRHKTRSTPQIKENILIILNFLINKGSATAYMLREQIL